MAVELIDPELGMALADVEAALDALGAVGFGGVGSGADVAAVVARVEGLGSRVSAVGFAVQAEADVRGLYVADGHASAKVLVRHAGRVSGAEASRRAKAVRALRDLPVLQAAHVDGRVGVEQVHRVARVWANPRVRQLVVDHDGVFVELAESLSYADFDAVLTDWERLADQDGAGDRARDAHEGRRASVGEVGGRFELRATCGGLQGLELREVLRHYVDAEFRADWAEARARLGEAATVEDLARTDAQRHMDALAQIFRDAAAHRAATPGGSTIETSVVCDQATFERETARLAGHDPGPDPRAATHLAEAAASVRASHAATNRARANGRTGAGDAAEAAAPTDQSERVSVPGVGFRCGSIDGVPLDPTEVVAHALVGHVRRAVLGADSVVIDLGRRSRLFTGPAALAVRLGNTTCYWPGCNVPVGRCQIDHLQPWAPPDRGRTDPRNGGPACARHNRHKQHGYTVWRDHTGTWHTHRPDGTEI